MEKRVRFPLALPSFQSLSGIFITDPHIRLLAFWKASEISAAVSSGVRRSEIEKHDEGAKTLIGASRMRPCFSLHLITRILSETR
jgi:hypothetical protein